MPRKWRNRIITRCSSNVNVAISVSKTLPQLDLFTSIQRVVQCCHLASPNLKNSHVSSNKFHVSICFHSREKKIRIPYNLNAPRIQKHNEISLPNPDSSARKVQTGQDLPSSEPIHTSVNINPDTRHIFLFLPPFPR